MAEGGRSRISLELRPELMNSFEVSHGGVIMTMLDVAMAVAARTSHDHVGGIMTVDMSLSFIRPAKGRIVAEGRVLRGGNSLHFCEGESLRRVGELVAKSLGTFKLRAKPRQGGIGRQSPYRQRRLFPGNTKENTMEKNQRSSSPAAPRPGSRKAISASRKATSRSPATTRCW
jgi:uncharacterized protein (TIGR00369 family)